MNSIKNYLFCTIVFAMTISLPSLAEITQTKKAYGIHGAPLNYHKVSGKKYTYNVRGSDYTVKSVATAKRYSKIGNASYYHDDFHGRRTANGEYFNNNSYTAAHKTLPLNTYVLVTNLRNKRKVIVRINDRGPFVAGRIIDLSKLAARELGFIHSGVAKVKVEALYVQKDGSISGIGAESLAELAKTDEAKDRLVYNDSDNLRESGDHQGNVTVNDESQFRTQPIIETEPLHTIFYQLRMVGLETQEKAENIISRLSGKYKNTHIVRSGNKYDIYFGNINTQSKINLLKADIRKITRSYQFIIYKYK